MHNGTLHPAADAAAQCAAIGRKIAEIAETRRASVLFFNFFSWQFPDRDMGAGASTKRAPVDGAEVERIFKDIDKNSDGVLTVTECARALRHLALRRCDRACAERIVVCGWQDVLWRGEVRREAADPVAAR